MSFTDIIFWLFARLRPVLWCAHRLAGQRFEDVERLARLRASRIRRPMHAAPILLIAGHRPQAAQPGLLASSSFFFFF